MSFDVFEDDNFAFMDDDERAFIGTFASYEEALLVAQDRVEAWLRAHFVLGMTGDQLWDEYANSGCDPFVRPGDFSAWQYAAKVIATLTDAEWRPEEVPETCTDTTLPASASVIVSAAAPGSVDWKVEEAKDKPPSLSELRTRRDDVVDNPAAVRFGRTSTISWSTRKGDHLLWVRCTNMFASGDSAFRILDYWELHDGDRVTITNEVANLPAGFELHPTEVQNSLCYEMMRRLEAGYQPGDIVDGPELWRVRSGDRIVWTGVSHDDRVAHNHIVALLDFTENALAAGASASPRYPEMFGAPTKDQPTVEELQRVRAGFHAAVGLGTPRTITLEWALG